MSTVFSVKIIVNSREQRSFCLVLSTEVPKSGCPLHPIQQYPAASTAAARCTWCLVPGIYPSWSCDLSTLTAMILGFLLCDARQLRKLVLYHIYSPCPTMVLGRIYFLWCSRACSHLSCCHRALNYCAETETVVVHHILRSLTVVAPYIPSHQTATRYPYIIFSSILVICAIPSCIPLSRSWLIKSTTQPKQTREQSKVLLIRSTHRVLLYIRVC